MIALGFDASLAVVGLALVLVAGWGSYLSVRSAAAGPEWALRHLAVVRPVAFGAVVLGVIMAVLIRPLWVGLSVIYVALAVTVLMSMVRRSLGRLADAGGLDLLPFERRTAIVARARRLFVVAGGALAAIGGIGVATGGGVVGWIAVALGVTLIGTAAVLAADDVEVP